MNLFYLLDATINKCFIYGLISVFILLYITHCLLPEFLLMVKVGLHFSIDNIIYYIYLYNINLT